MSKCCEYPIITETDKITCSNCDKLLLHKGQIFTPCCKNVPYYKQYEDEVEPLIRCNCGSTWDILGNIVFMEPTWLFREGFDV